ncbi:MAG TPA: DUF1571 domain-containing protein [Planctomycetaceae bacterium]|jgi:outer membrane lipoprotein-sorting protein
MSRLFSLGIVNRGSRRGAAGFVLSAMMCAAGLGWTIPHAAAKDKVRSKGRAAQAEAAQDAQSAEQTTANDEKSDDTAAPALTLRDVIAFARKSRAALNDVKDYTAHFSKLERIGNSVIQQEMDMKFRTKPFSVYFLYQSNNEQGRQAIFVDGRNNNYLLVKEAKGVAGFIGAVRLKLDDPRVKAENLYPVTHVGIANMLDETINNWERDLQIPGDEVDVQFFPNAKFKGVPCQAIQVTHLKKLKELKYSKNRIYFDKETNLPIRGERFGWARRAGEEPPLVEDYRYTNLKTNVNLTDADFTPARYGF